MHFKFLASFMLAGAVLLAGAGSASGAEPFKLGYLVDASGPQGTTMKPTLEAFQLYIDGVNRQGGINGRQIQILTRDVQSDTQRSLDAVQELKGQNVSALLGLAATNTHAAVYAKARQLSLPVVAATPVNIPIVLPPAKADAFGVGQELGLTGIVGGHFAHRLKPDGKIIACVAFEVPGSILGCNKIVAQAKAEGYTRGEVYTVPIGQRDFRTVVDKLVQLNPDVVSDCLGREHVAALLPALASSAYRGIFLSMDTGIGDDTLIDSVPAASKLKVYSYARFVSNADGTGPQLDALRAALKGAHITKTSTSYAGGWALGLVIGDALRQCAGQCGPEDFNKALEKVDIDSGGLTGTRLRLTSQDHYGPSAYLLYQLNPASKRLDRVGGWQSIASNGELSK
jgi:branched-chain amino acid transport system substrate-binding protein